MEYPVRRYWELLARYLRPLRAKVGWLALLIFSVIGLQLVHPQIVRYFIDTAMNSDLTSGVNSAVADGAVSGSSRQLFLAALAFLGAAFALQGVSVAAAYVGEDVGWRATNQLRADLAHHCLHLDMAFHNDHTPGEMIERIDRDIADIAIFFSQFVIRILGNVLLIVGVLGVLLWEDWRLSTALAAYVMLALIGLAYMRQIGVPHWKASRQASADLFGFLEEQLAGTEDVRSSGAVPYVIHHLFRFNRILFQKELKGRTMGILVVIVWTAMYTLGQVVALVASYLLFQRGLITVGAVFMVVYYTDIIFRPLNQITREIQNLQKAAAGIERVESLTSLQSKIQDIGQGQLPCGPLTVIFDDVTFGYSADEPVLRQISFDLPAGKVLGILGRTGSGKTTMTRLLFRLYDPVSGAIRLDSAGAQEADSSIENGKATGSKLLTDIREVSIHMLRQRIGMITQDVQLFRATVRDNLTLFDRTIADDQIKEVIAGLELSTWFAALPNGLDTVLATEGNNLSAGEAQLLAFTRIFLKDPGLVVLDEASSRVDPATERLIERAVDKLLQDRTGIVIAHRLNTVQRADFILILEQGRIVEYGERQHLAANPASRFYSLLQTGLQDVLA
jgi:ABC-type multidrug transport system fused ATPase/permease subunit